jgi:hypothetical protein
MRAPRYIERDEVIGGMKFLNPIRKDELIMACHVYDIVENKQPVNGDIVPRRFLEALDREYDNEWSY